MSSPANGEKTNSGGVTWKHIVFLGLGRTTPAEPPLLWIVSSLPGANVLANILRRSPMRSAKRQKQKGIRPSPCRRVNACHFLCSLLLWFVWLIPKKNQIKVQEEKKKKQLLFTCIYLERECLQEDLISWVLPSMGIRVRWHLKIHTQKGAGSERRAVVCQMLPPLCAGQDQAVVWTKSWGRVWALRDKVRVGSTHPRQVGCPGIRGASLRSPWEKAIAQWLGGIQAGLSSLQDPSQVVEPRRGQAGMGSKLKQMRLNHKGVGGSWAKTQITYR